MLIIDDSEPLDMALVSIVTPCYCAEATLARTIDSVAEQTYSNIEYIVIDGGSKDGTVDIIKQSHRAGLVTKWISEPDKGISDAFSKGIRLARGEYVQIVNADDWLYPDQVEKAVRILEENPGVGFVYGNLDIYDCGGEYLRTNVGEVQEIDRRCPSMQRMPHSTFMVRRSVYDAIGGYSSEYRNAMDLEWVMRARKAGVKALYVPELKGVMRLGGVSNRYRSNLMRENAEIYEKYELSKWESKLHYLVSVCKDHLGNWFKKPR